MLLEIKNVLEVNPNTPLLISDISFTGKKIFCCKINTTKIINEILENEFSSQSMLKFNKNTFNISVNFNQFLDFDVRDNALLYLIHLINFVNRKKIF